MTSEGSSGPSSVVTRRLSEEARDTSARGGMSPVQYLCATLAALVLAVSVRPLLVALTALVELAR